MAAAVAKLVVNKKAKSEVLDSINGIVTVGDEISTHHCLICALFGIDIFNVFLVCS